MSTRAIIARPTDDGWQGTYHHSDGYPTHLGKVLHNACREFFDGSPEAMLKFIIDEHPGGWSFLGNGDPSTATGYADYDHPTRVSFPVDPSVEADMAAYRADQRRPRCYCHSLREGDRGSDARVTQADVADLWDIEWTYICTPDKLMIFMGCTEMQAVGAIRWDEEVSDERWGKIQCGENFERCTHIASFHVPNLPDEYKRVGMAILTGAQQPEVDDAIAFEIKGVRVVPTGSGHSEGFYADRGMGKSGERVGGTRWFGSVEFPDGTRKDVPLWSQKTRKPCQGVVPIYPKTLIELTKEAVSP